MESHGLEVIGDKTGVKGLRLDSTCGLPQKTIMATGVFVAIGHDPATEAFQGAVELDDEGYVIAEPGVLLLQLVVCLLRGTA